MNRWIIFLIGFSFLTSCSDDKEIKVYRLAKEKTTSKRLEWTTPEQWEEQPASGMRTASFLVEGVDISVIFLGGAAGGNLPNVNRWRDQISLPPWTEGEFAENRLEIDIPLGPTTIMDFSNRESNQRIIAAIVPFGSGTWFFKMMGNHDVMETQKPIFIKFLSTVHMSND